MKDSDNSETPFSDLFTNSQTELPSYITSKFTETDDSIPENFK